MIPKYDNMIMRLFVLRIGNKKEDRFYRLAYGVFRPCLEKMTKPTTRTMKNHRKSGIEKGLEDIRKGNVHHAKNSQDLVNQILG